MGVYLGVVDTFEWDQRAFYSQSTSWFSVFPYVAWTSSKKRQSRSFLTLNLRLIAKKTSLFWFTLLLATAQLGHSAGPNSSPNSILKQVTCSLSFNKSFTTPFRTLYHVHAPYGQQYLWWPAPFPIKHLSSPSEMPVSEIFVCRLTSSIEIGPCTSSSCNSRDWTPLLARMSRRSYTRKAY